MDTVIRNNNQSRSQQTFSPTPVSQGNAARTSTQSQSVDGIADYVDQYGQDNAVPFSATQVPVELTPPTVKATPENIYELVAFINKILSGSCEANLESRLDLRSQVSRQRVFSLGEALVQINESKASLAKCLEDLKNKSNALDAADRALAEANAQYSEARNRLYDSQSRLEELANELKRDPDNPDTRSKFLSAQNAVNADQLALEQAQTALSSATQIFETAYAEASTAADAALVAQAWVVKATEDYVVIDRNGAIWAVMNSGDPKSAMDALVEIMAFLSGILSKTELNKLQSSNGLTEKLQAERIRQCKDLADKYATAVQEAQDNQDKAKLANKIFSGLIVGLSVLAAPFCGPLAILAAVAALSVFTADCVLDEKGETTVSEWMMVPVQFLIEELADGIVYIVEHEAKKYGKEVDKDKLELAAKIVSTIIVSATIAALTFFMAKGAANSSTLSSVANSTRFSIKLTQYSPETLRAIFTTAQTVNGLIGAGVQCYMGYQVSLSRAAGKESEADMGMIYAELNMLKALVDRCINQFCNADTAMELTKQTSDIIAQTHRTKTAIIRNIPG